MIKDGAKGNVQMINPVFEYPVMQMLENDHVHGDIPLAMAYIKRQTVLDTMPTTEAFSCGTLFRELYKPFMPEMRK